MRNLPDNAFSLCIADPPYGLGDKLVIGGSWAKRYQEKGASWDKPITKEYFDEIFRISEHWIIWGGNYYIPYIPSARHFIVWRKPWMEGMKTMSNCEIAFSNFDTNARCVDFNRESDARIHVCQKPKALYSWLLKTYHNTGGGVFDPFLGSGSSRIAAYNLGIDFIGCERDKEYYDLQEKRFKEQCLGEHLTQNGQTIKQLSLF